MCGWGWLPDEAGIARIAIDGKESTLPKPPSAKSDPSNTSRKHTSLTYQSQDRLRLMPSQQANTDPFTTKHRSSDITSTTRSSDRTSYQQRKRARGSGSNQEKTTQSPGTSRSLITQPQQNADHQKIHQPLTVAIIFQTYQARKRARGNGSKQETQAITTQRHPRPADHC